MRIRTGVAVLLGLLLASCGGNGQAERKAAPVAKAGSAQRIAVVEGLAGPEGVRYDPELDVYYVSNFNGAEAGDGNGFVSRVGPDGAILAREFMTGTAQAPLHGPRGMFITGDTLWVTDADGVHAFDRRGGAQIGFVDFRRFVPGFLNDIARGDDGALYVTDTDSSRIFRLVGDDVTVALRDTSLCGPNGIMWDAATARFLLASWNRGASVHAWRPGSNVVVAIGGPGPGGFDGIERVGAHILIASQADSSLHELSDTGESVLFRVPGAPADIGVDTRRGRVAVPMVDRNQVEIWKLPA